MPRVLLTGASGQLGAYLLRDLLRKEVAVVAWSGSRQEALFGVSPRPVDLSDCAALTAAFRETRPDLVLHVAALARVADCQRDPEAARRVNVEGTAHLSRLSADAGARFVHVSTDLVFDGEHAPYHEEDPVCPLSIYGRTKAEAEAAVLAVPGAAVVRVSLLFGPSLTGRPSFFDEQLVALRERRPVKLFTDEWRTPLDLDTAAQSLVAIAQSDCSGLLHVGGRERLSRLEMGRRLADFLGVDSSVIVPLRRDQAPAPEPRPRDTSLDSSHWRRLFPEHPWPTYEEALGTLGIGRIIRR